MRKFKVGDKVRLVSGSDEMTIYAVFGLRLVECEWYGKEGKIYKNSFRPEYLEFSDEDVTARSIEQVVSEKNQEN